MAVAAITIIGYLVAAFTLARVSASRALRGMQGGLVSHLTHRLPSPALIIFTYKLLNTFGCLSKGIGNGASSLHILFHLCNNLFNRGFSVCSIRVSKLAIKGRPALINVASCLLKMIWSRGCNPCELLEKFW